MKATVKFGALVIVIIGTLAWLAAGGINDSKSYYKTISEITRMSNDEKAKKLRVAGNVEAGSIARHGADVAFTLVEEGLKLKVVYNGTDPLPDTFKDGAQALADGKLTADGTFHANKISAKCASKYEVKPGGKYNDNKPLNQKQAGI